MGVTVIHRGSVRIPTVAGLLPLLVCAQRPGGEIRRRTDNQGREYFEVFADHVNGNHGYPAPMRSGRRPKRVLIAAESTWSIAAGVVVDAGGGSSSCAGATGAADRCPAPNLPWGALLARWVTLDITRDAALWETELSTKPVSAWFLAGKQKVVDVPIPSTVSPRPHKPVLLALFSELGKLEEFHYTPLVALQFECNDASSAFRDNDGWLHVYQQWQW
jgi:hypothetical protein